MISMEVCKHCCCWSSGVAAVWSYSGGRPTVETRTTVYVVPWPWQLEWDGSGFVMRLEVKK